ncbi:sucrose-phosphate synthase 2 [Artemisia annua]|uniref:Sucrose-phosphate synthase 2 n=1 Tax=Artemisia annua TaxID=35608 RepID=A0A2U1KD85_ARTAN|nr:sucrose-phosphate synthase 2 [Artemisia annua]
MLAAGSDDPDDEVGESSGAYIIRIPFGLCGKYLRKELHSPHIQEFVDEALAHVLNISMVLGEQIGGGHPMRVATLALNFFHLPEQNHDLAIELLDGTLEL